LVLIPWLFHWEDPGLTFDIALHIGTLIAVIIFFWKDWLRLVTQGFTAPRTTDGRLFWYLIIATVPGTIVGYALEQKAETIFRAPLLIAIALIVMGAILFWAERKSSKKDDLNNITLQTSLLIGLSQVLAIIPGVSRSGITITTGLLSGLRREAATRFSFLLSTPIILGAAIIKVPYLVSHPDVMDANFLIGMVVAFVVGIASISFLLRYVQTKTFLPFVWYRFAIGVLVIIIINIR
jgi:undecaprenyl-diphosphatase